MGRDAPVLGAELGFWERAGSSASWWLVDLPSPVALPSHPVCHGRGGGNGLHGPPWALPLEHSSLPPGGPEACQGDLHIPTFPHSPSRPSEFHPKLVTSKLRWDPRNLKAEFWAAIASGQDTAMSSAHTWEPPPPRCEAHDSLCLFVFRFHHGCLEAEKTDAGPRALAPAQGKWDTHVCKESICEV